MVVIVKKKKYTVAEGKIGKSVRGGAELELGVAMGKRGSKGGKAPDERCGSFFGSIMFGQQRVCSSEIKSSN